jgi:prephenate dehydrogenase
MTAKTIGIIGGKGLMGNFFREVFEAQGFRVLISDIKTKLTNEGLVRQSDIVVFSVPIPVTQKVIKSVIRFTREDQILMDLTSLKTIAVNEMLKSKAQVIGLHPMCRPSSLMLKGQTVVVCEARAKKETVKFIKNIFQKAGAETIEMSAREHDQHMSIIQVLLHFHTIVLGNTMRRLGVDITKTLQVSSPIYRLEMDLIGRIFSQNAELYGAIAMYNPETKKVTAALKKETENMSKIVLYKNLKQFVKAFSDTSEFLGEYKDIAMAETNKLLTFFKK